MDALTAFAAFAMTVLSAALLYVGSPNCAWRPGPTRGIGGTRSGLLLAAAALLPWSLLLGFGAGLCAMLGTWMLALMLLPWLGWTTSGGAPEMRDHG